MVRDMYRGVGALASGWTEDSFAPFTSVLMFFLLPIWCRGMLVKGGSLGGEESYLYISSLVCSDADMTEHMYSFRIVGFTR